MALRKKSDRQSLSGRANANGSLDGRLVGSCKWDLFSRWFFATLSFAPSYGEIPQMVGENKSRTHCIIQNGRDKAKKGERLLQCLK